MSRYRFIALVALLAVPTLVAAARFAPSRQQRLPDDLPSLAALACSENRDLAEAAIAQLRAVGPQGLAALVDRLPPEPSAEQGVPRAREEAKPDDATLQLRRAIDKVAAQQDAWASRLYWHTDFDRALLEAQATNRPILSLHLLGQLDEELSCANSRFFRQVLYCDPQVGELLRERFVLYWHSVRPVPVATIDFGDGRKLVRTITGNSLHYVLDREGRLVDALPGMYGPRDFERLLTAAETVARETASMEDGTRRDALASFHGQAMSQRFEELQSILTRAGVDASRPEVALLLTPSAVAESSALADATLWEQLASADPRPGQLSPAARRFVIERTPQAAAAAELAISKMKVENPLLRALLRFETSLRADTLRNELVLHRVLHDWLLASAPATREELAAFNARVYAELFLAPLDDPWAGLMNPGVYDGLGDTAMVVDETAGD